MNTLTRPPAFIITIDTEGDDLWSRPRTITTQNSRYLPRFQQLCERHGFKPTYLTNYEMSLDPCFVAFGKRAAKDKVAEIGMHLHAWNSPPLTPLTDDDDHHQPLLVEYPHDVLYEKVKFLTHHLERIFELKMISHRAGRCRWPQSTESRPG